MTASRELEIRRIYTSSPLSVATSRSVSRPRSTRISILGLLSLVVGMGWIYVTWWPADSLITTNMFRAMPDIIWADLGERMFRVAPPELADPAPPPGADASAKRFRPPKPPQAGKLTDAERVEIAFTQKVLAVVPYGWLTITTAAALWLAFCSGAGVAMLGLTDPTKRRSMVLVALIALLVAAGLSAKLWHGKSIMGLSDNTIGFLLCACAAAGTWILVWALPVRFTAAIGALAAILLAAAGWWVWREYGASFPTVTGRLGAVAGAVVLAFIGSAFSRRVLGLHKLAIAAVLLATVTTLIGLVVAQKYDAIRTHDIAASQYATIAIAQSSYAWVLMILLALRIR
jgi:hypothetical protein